jgi:hypothetical protein
MLVTAASFWQVVLAIHILVVVACFGVLVTYPVISIAAERLDRTVTPTLHRVRIVIARSLVNPGLLVVLAAGIYLAADLHLFKQFFVMWGIAAIVVLGALEGAYMIRASKKLAELSQRDVDAAGGGEIKWSDEYVSARSRYDQVAILMAGIVLVTGFLMTVN